MIEQIKSELSASMDKSIQTLQKQIAKVRTGRATASVLDGVTDRLLRYSDSHCPGGPDFHT